MRDGYDTFDLVWCARNIEVRCQANWLNSSYWHIELRCEERLPVTETGYRSHFVIDDAISDQEDVHAYVLAWLDETAREPSWQRQIEDNKQLKLF